MTLETAKLLIAGEWRVRDAQPVHNPYDESEVAQRAHANEQDLTDAVTSAEEAFPQWRAIGPGRRAEILLRAAQLLRERAETIAQALTLEQGKPLSQARSEIEYSAAMIEWDAAEGRRVYGRIVPASANRQYAVHRQPIGIVAGFSPWNFPVSSPTKKLSAPLAAGCAVIIKPSEATPMSGYEVVRAFHDAGIPKGVINLLYGDPAAISGFLVPHRSIRAVTFTGSVPVGMHLGELTGRHLKPALLELGGHAPVFVSASADIAKVAALSAEVKAINAGQVCVSPTRFFIEESAYEEFAWRMAERANAIRYGDGRSKDTELGPLISSQRRRAVQKLIADARVAGARLLAGGECIAGRGFGHQLTILGEVPPTVRAMREEPFGPLALLTRVANVEEAVERANAIDFGLTGYAFTRSAHDMNVLTERLQVGNLGINQFVASVLETPFGGVKDSGIGRSGGIEGLETFTQSKVVLTQFD